MKEGTGKVLSVEEENENVKLFSCTPQAFDLAENMHMT
jgi:hypothetical protein